MSAPELTDPGSVKKSKPSTRDVPMPANSTTTDAVSSLSLPRPPGLKRPGAGTFPAALPSVAVAVEGRGCVWSSRGWPRAENGRRARLPSQDRLARGIFGRLAMESTRHDPVPDLST